MLKAKGSFSGSRIRGETEYMLDFMILNGTQNHKLKFDKDDVIQFRVMMYRLP